MSNRLTFMERLSERLTALEAIIRKLEPVESFLERVELLEKNIYATKKVFTFSEACMYIGVSESMLYKLILLSAKTQKGINIPPEAL